MAIEELNELNKLNFKKQLTFAYLICERLYPNYVFFSQNFNFGNCAALREAIDFLYSNLIYDNINPSRIQLLIQEVDKNIPQTAEYDTVLASSALDACTTIIETLYFLLDKQASRLIDISTMATDTVDMYIQEIKNLDFNNDENFQQKIDNHPLMKKEISVQKGIIKYLISMKNIEPSDITILLQLQEANCGNLNLFKS